MRRSYRLSSVAFGSVALVGLRKENCCHYYVTSHLPSGSGSPLGSSTHIFVLRRGVTYEFARIDLSFIIPCQIPRIAARNSADLPIQFTKDVHLKLGIVPDYVLEQSRGTLTSRP